MLFRRAKFESLTQLTQNLSGTADDQTLGFSYTNASQISQRTATNDAYNWTPPTANRSYTRNGLNQYSAVAGVSFSHDARGNLTSDGSRTFAYDLENRLTSVSGSASLSLAYDPLGRLRSTAAGGTTTEFLCDGDRLVAEYVGGSLQRRYAQGAGVDEPLVWYEGAGTTDRRWLVVDHLGSIIASTDAGGSTTRYRYGPYGEPDSWTGSRFRYTGQAALPEAQLYHYKARAYDPVLGRFLQTDPTVYSNGINIYAAFDNSPINNLDPTGLQTLQITRPVYANVLGLRIRVGSHAFTSVIPENGQAIRRFSYGPDEGSPGSLAFDALGNSGRMLSQTNTGSLTDLDDLAALGAVMNDRGSAQGISTRVLNVDDDAAIASGEWLDQALVARWVRYDMLPDRFDAETGGFNSNTSNQLVDEMAAIISGSPSPGAPAGSNQSWTPGWELWGDMARYLTRRSSGSSRGNGCATRSPGLTCGSGMQIWQ